MPTNLPQVAEDKILAEDINRYSGVLPQTAGETINGATLPAACYLNSADGEWYACDGNDQTKLDFKGFAISNGTDGNGINIQCSGKVTGFSGLTTGAKYYVQDDKTIGTTPGTYEVLVGIAISATELFILKGSMEYMGSANDSGDNITVPAAARFAVVKMIVTNAVGVFKGEVFLSRLGKTTGNLTDWQGSGSSLEGVATWTGSTIALTHDGTAIEGTGYFYR